LVNLIAGLMPPDKGKILIDGHEIQDLDIRTYQSRIGYISQEPVIFNESIFNNVTFWAVPSSANLQRFWEALEKAAILDFVKSLDGQENTLLGNNGINLSGGQRQRLSIARELYKEIDILVMDEATSALDSETEKAIQDNIDQLKGHYTVLIVAHRLSTIRNADEVILMSQGRIEEKGSFQNLIKYSSEFKKMVELQEVI
jgi:ABC-type multidrug transport system fused ATPase/permease subunit